MYGDKTLYPMLGVGAFVVMFWVGFVSGYEAGLGCLILPIGFLFGALGTQLVVTLEQRANGRYRRPPVEKVQTRPELLAPMLYRRAD